MIASMPKRWWQVLLAIGDINEECRALEILEHHNLLFPEKISQFQNWTTLKDLMQYGLINGGNKTTKGVVQIYTVSDFGAQCLLDFNETVNPKIKGDDEAFYSRKIHIYQRPETELWKRCLLLANFIKPRPMVRRSIAT